MRIKFYLTILFLFMFIGCRPQNVKVTITYDKQPSYSFPYTYYGETAKIYYTISGRNYENQVKKRQSIQLTVPEKTQIRVTFEKFISDASGQRTTLEDAYYKASSKNPNFIIK